MNSLKNLLYLLSNLTVSHIVVQPRTSDGAGRLNSYRKMPIAE